ncbi:hypothetical protein HKX40_02985 [Pelistega europaea]|uniref:Uncharacterized protein n=2 Tax=Pelistega europaea TaxID=106147 RepID=A0A7Y4P5Q6_9BURK|nr:hypothetical protein [Pelistega europaea]NOL49109.1 hypothetical protein [Pelistega europaea]
MGVGGKAAYAGANLASAGTVMGLQTAGAEYKQSRDSGLTPIQSIPYAASQAAIEVATESIPAMVFFKNLKQGAPFYQTVLNSLAAEIPSEQVATILQDANEWAVLNPEKTFKDYLSERPDRAVSTAISTITSTLILGSAGHTVQRIADRKAKKDLQAYQANVMGEVMKQTSDATRQSKLAERDPETFQTYLQSVFNQSGVENVYLSAEVLAQSGLVEKMAEVMPSVKEQVALAAETGQDLKIPAAEYFAYAPKIDTADSLLPHLKVDANGMTVAEAQEYAPKAKELLQADFEQEAAKAEQEDSFKESAQKVQDTITQQLIATGRFTNDQARIQASLTGAVYAATAKRLNMTPEALFNVYQMNVVGGEPVGVELNQALKSNPPRGWVHAESGEDAIHLFPDGPAQAKEGAVFWTDLGDRTAEVLPSTKGYSHSLSGYAAQHIFNHHGDSEYETSRGQIAVVREDLARIPDIVQNYDFVRTDIKDEQGNQQIAYVKKYDDAVVLYLETASRKKKDFRGVSMWKYPSTSDAKKMLEANIDPTLYGQNRERASFHGENANTVSDESQYYQEDNAKVNYRQAYEQAVAEGRTELSYELYVQVRTPEFKAWFGDWENDPANASKVVNPRTGEPLVVYHGTTADFDTFEKTGLNDAGWYGKGFYATAFPEDASEYSYYHTDIHDPRGSMVSESGEKVAIGANVMPLFMNIRNPFVVKEFETTPGETVDSIKSKGFDGVLVLTQDGLFREVMALNPTQIKSSVGNTGRFDANNSNILYQLDEDVNSAFAQAVDEIANGKKIDLRNSKKIKLGTTPDVFAMLGLPSGDFRIDESVIEKIMGVGLGVGKGKYTNLHNLTASEVKAIPIQLNSPIAVFKSSSVSTNPKGFVVLTELQEYNVERKSVEPVIVALHVKKHKKDYDVVDVASAHGRTATWLEKQINGNPTTGETSNLLYVDKVKGQQFLNTISLQLVRDFTSDADLHARNVKTDTDLRQYQSAKNNALYPQSHQHTLLDREAKKFAVIQGNPVYEIVTRTALKDNEGLRQWAIEIFNKAGNQAISPELGKVTLNERSVKDSMAHGMNALKASAFEAVPAVIEKGVVVATAEHGRTSSKYISAPVRIEGVETIVTGLYTVI